MRRRMKSRRLKTEVTNMVQDIFDNLLFDFFDWWLEDGNNPSSEKIHPERPDELNFNEWFSYN